MGVLDTVPLSFLWQTPSATVTMYFFYRSRTTLHILADLRYDRVQTSFYTHATLFLIGTDRSLSALMKCRLPTNGPTGVRSTIEVPSPSSPVPGWKREGSPRASPADVMLKTNQGPVCPSSRLFSESGYKRKSL